MVRTFSYIFIYFFNHKVILNWFVNPDVTLSAINDGKIIEPSVITKGPINISSAALEQDADLDRTERFFSTRAWRKISNLINLRRKHGYECFVCRKKLKDGDNTIRCDGCLQWGHFDCAGVKKKPKATFWYCSQCRGH